MKRGSIYLAGFMLLLTAPCFATDDSLNKSGATLGIQEIKIGMSKEVVTEILKNHKDAKCYTPDSCQEMTFIKRPVKITYLFGKEIKKLLSIHVEYKNLHYEAMKQGLVEKYGSNYETQAAVWQNKAGAKFENTISKWEHTDGSIELKYYGSKLDMGEIFMTSKELIQEIDAEKNKEKQLPGF